MNKKILLVDGINLLFRGYYALPLLTNAEGVHTNAVYGFLNMLSRFLDEEKPGYVIVAFDTHHPTFRAERYDAYKGGRAAMPEELRPQIPLIKEVLGAMGMCMAECPGFEADDVIGTLAAQAEAAGYTPVMLSGDRDLLQLTTDVTRLLLPRTKGGKPVTEDYRADDVLKTYGVSPRAYIDVKALMGDSSDNIPGVPGIGEVTATKIIAAYGSLEAAIAHAGEIKPKKASENLLTYQEQARFSKELATIVTDAPVIFSPEAAALPDIWNAQALAVFQRLELKNFYPRFKKSEAEAESDRRVVDNPFEADALFATREAAAFRIVTEGECEGEGDEWAGLDFAVAGQPPAYIPMAYVDADALRAWCESDAQKKLAYDTKRERRLLTQRGIDLRGVVFDAMLAGYVLNEPLPSPAPAAVAAAYPRMTEALRGQGQWGLYADIELPLAEVLADMEDAGLYADPDILAEYGAGLEARLAELTEEIHACAGEAFNIQSPAQLGHILFEKLGLPGTKKTKQGWSTAADVLEKLKARHPIVPLALAYRAHAKLKSTYVDGLLTAIHPETHRVHSTFHQALTATGRLSSAEPNLQNIPVRMPLGRELRRAFTAPGPDYVLMDADYSQIELRILAHMSGDENLVQAYIDGQDIHRATAAQVFGVPPEDVTPAQRSAAKAVNFGIVYGISAFGLSEDLHIPKKEAERYIQGYFEQYPKVKAYLDESVARAKRDGYAVTLYNRRRAVPELTAGSFALRGFGERVAMNMPIQGTAADIIKIAMIRVYRRLKKEKAASRLVLQVHDELLLEVAKAELAAVRVLVREEMENAAALSVPLTADIHEGESWYAAK